MSGSSVVGVGVDIEEIDRFRKMPFDKNRAFYEKIFTKAEIKYCLSKADSYPHFAVRFCAKEAVLKAFWPENPFQVEVTFESGKPAVKNLFPDRKIHLSLAHTKKQAIAFVVVEKS